MKKRIRKTGEVVDVISFTGYSERDDKIDFVSYIDSKGREKVRIPLNYYWDLEDVEEEPAALKTEVDWEKRRYELVKMLIHATVNAPIPDGCDPHVNIQSASKWAVEFADALIAELKKGGE